MKKLSELFYECAYVDNWQVVGNDVNYKFVEEDDTLYIYWQGSSSVTDWIRNFLFKRTPYKDMNIPYKVHRGFLTAWKEAEDIIINKITETRTITVKDEDKKRDKLEKVYKYKHIVVVGYSHGGALCCLSHEAVWYHRPDLRESGLESYAFESPRMYGGFFVKKALRERWRTLTVIRTNNDLVTHCPPCIFRYCHVGTILKLKGDTSLVDKKWTPKCIKSHYPQVVYDACLKYEESQKTTITI